MARAVEGIDTSASSASHSDARPGNAQEGQPVQTKSADEGISFGRGSQDVCTHNHGKGRHRSVVYWRTVSLSSRQLFEVVCIAFGHRTDCQLLVASPNAWQPR